MTNFQHDGDTYPMPDGWHGLSCEKFFFKLEQVRAHIMRADELNLEPVINEDGDPLDPEDWSKSMQQEATKYHELYVHYSEHYRRMYGG